MLNDEVLGRRTPNLRSPRGLAAIRDTLILKAMHATLRGKVKGRMRLTLPSGRSTILGSGADGHQADLTMGNFALARRAIRRGTLGFAESFIEEDIETEDLGNVFRFFLDNFDELDRAGRGWFRVRISDRIAHYRRRNTRSGSRRNIAAHYDLGNAFYAPWLDTTMTYSSALFETPQQSLEDAQRTKYESILEALDLRPGMHVLEIGCGWGQMAEMLARKGVHVTALTLSREQLRFTRDRIEAAGLSGLVDVRFEDYRDVSGKFDRIVSIEMIEAVGESHWPIYFRTLRDRLKPGGHAVLQAITIDEGSFETYRRNPDFIQRYIFPGGMLPSVTAMQSNAAANDCEVETLRRFGADYAATLRIWHDRFRAAWPQLLSQGFDERFRRTWEYYLIYCEVGFERGLIDVGHYRVRPIRSTT